MIEAIVTAAIAAIVMLSVLSVLQATTKSRVHLESQLKSTQTSAAGLKLLRTELESAGSKFPNALWAVKVLNNVSLGVDSVPLGVAINSPAKLEVASASDSATVRLKPNTDVIDIAIGDEGTVPGTIVTALKNASKPRFVMNAPDPFTPDFYGSGSSRGVALFQNRDGQGCVAIVSGLSVGGTSVLQVESFLNHHFEENPDTSVRSNFHVDGSTSSNSFSLGAKAYTAPGPLSAGTPGLRNQSYVQPSAPPSVAVLGGCPNDDLVGSERMAVYKLAKRRRFGVFHHSTSTGQNVTDGSGNGNAFLGVIESIIPGGGNEVPEFPSATTGTVTVLVPNVVDLELSPRIQVSARRKTLIPWDESKPLNVECNYNSKVCTQDCSKGTCLINGPGTAISFDPNVGGPLQANIYPGTMSLATVDSALERMWAMQVGLDITLITRGDSLKGDERSFDTSYKDYVDPALLKASAVDGSITKDVEVFGQHDKAICDPPAAADVTKCGMTKYPLAIDSTSIALRNLRMTSR